MAKEKFEIVTCNEIISIKRGGKTYPIISLKALENFCDKLNRNDVSDDIIPELIDDFKNE